MISPINAIIALAVVASAIAAPAAEKRASATAPAPTPVLAFRSGCPIICSPTGGGGYVCWRFCRQAPDTHPGGKHVV